MATGQDSAELKRRIAAVKDRIAVSDIVGKDVKLIKAGREFQALCPFHSENTPSFTINDEKQLYKCFGCGVSGDVIKYIQERTGEPFMTVLRDLEGDAGIAFDTPENRAEIDARRIERQRSADAEAAQKRDRARGLWLYAAPIKGTPAQQYLEETRAIDFALLGKIPGALRYRHDCWHPFLKEKIPAMVSAIIDIEGQHVATHQTFLEYRGGRWEKLRRIDAEASRKAGCERFHNAKMILGKFKGASIPIWKGDCREPLHRIRAGMGVSCSEGVEDALSFAMVDPTRHIRAAGTLDKIGSLILPRQAGDLTIIGQYDKASDDGSRSAVDQLEDAIAMQQDQADAQASEDGEVRRILMAWPPERSLKDWSAYIMAARDKARGVAL